MDNSLQTLTLRREPFCVDDDNDDDDDCDDDGDDNDDRGGGGGLPPRGKCVFATVKNYDPYGLKSTKPRPPLITTTNRYIV